jgi:hypothetical protein
VPLFKKGTQAAPAPVSDAGHAAMSSRDEFMRRLGDEVWRARRYGRPLGIVCLAPRMLTGEHLGSGERAAALQALNASLRRSDFSGEVGESVFAATLPETGDAECRAVAFRLRSELSLRSSATRRINWHVGNASVTEEETAEALLLTALESMRA